MLKEEFPKQEALGEEHDATLEEVREKVDIEKLQNELSAFFGERSTEDTKETRNIRIRRVVEALGRMTLELKEKAGEYDAILSDDTSGRLVSRIFEKVINRELEREGGEKIPLYFVKGNYVSDPEREDIHNFIQKKAREEDIGKVLVVTEYIHSGFSMDNFTKILDELGVEYDIAALSVYNTSTIKDNHPKLFERLVYGDAENSPGLIFHGRERHSGVTKRNRHRSEEYRRGAHPRKDTFAKSQNIKDAREDVNKIAGELSNLLREDVENK